MASAAFAERGCLCPEVCTQVSDVAETVLAVEQREKCLTCSLGDLWLCQGVVAGVGEESQDELCAIESSPEVVVLSPIAVEERGEVMQRQAAQLAGYLW